MEANIEHAAHAADGPGAAVRDDQGRAYRLRACEPRDEAAILALLRITVGETAGSRKTTEFWHWKHRDNPFGASYSVCATTDADEIVSLRSLMRWRFRGRAGPAYTAARPVDTATHPDYQRRGLFSALTRFCVDDLQRRRVAFLFNTPNGNSLPGYLKLGWRLVGRWPLYVRAASWRRGGTALVLRRLRLHGTATAVEERAVTLPTWRSFRERHGAELGALVEAHELGRRQVGYRTERSAEFLDWRYGAHPDIAYRVHALRDRDGLEGLVIGRTVDGMAGLRCLLVTEMFLRTPTARAGATLLRSLLRACGCDYLTAHFAAGTVERDALRSAGFVRAPGRGYDFVARALNAVPDDPALPDSWDLTLGELEIF